MRHPKVMVSTLKVAAFASLILAVLGCSEKKTTKEGQEEKILATPEEIVSQMHQMTNDVFGIKQREGRLDFRNVSKSISAITNDETRLELLDKLSDCVLSFDVSSLSYYHQNNALYSIEDIMKNVVFGNFPGRYQMGLDAYYELYYDYKLRLMEWRRRQIRRTAPKHRIEHPYVILDEAEDEERQWWRQIHFHGMVCYEGDLRMLEGESQLYMRRISKESADRIRAKIENYLGRPLRTLDQLKADGKSKRRVEFTEPDDPHAAP